MDMYSDLPPLFLAAGSLLQGIFALRFVSPLPMPPVLAVLGAGLVLCSAWLERDLVLLFGQVFVAGIFWKTLSPGA